MTESLDNESPRDALNSLLDVFEEYLRIDDNDCWSLPPQAYFSTELAALEQRRIFAREWLCVGREEHVPDVGDYFTLQLLNDPIVVVRGEDGAVRALSSICRHRLMPVVDGRGNTDRFTCPYHKWTYDTQGALLAAPYMKGSTAFNRSECRLPAYRLACWAGFLFVNLDGSAPPLHERMCTLNTHVKNYRVPDQVEIMRYETEWAGNWKLAAENSMEYYHHVGLHEGTVGVQMPAREAYVPPAPEDLSFAHARCGMGAEFKAGSEHPMNPRGRLDLFNDEELTTGYMVYVFPAFTMAMRPNANNWLSFRPAGVERTQVLGGYLVSREVLEEYPDIAAERRELILAVNEEDSRATIELARVLRSRHAARGPLSPLEATLAQFYRYLARQLTGN